MWGKPIKVGHIGNGLGYWCAHFRPMTSHLQFSRDFVAQLYCATSELVDSEYHHQHKVGYSVTVSRDKIASDQRRIQEFAMGEADPGFVWWGHMASWVARAYNGGLGAEPPAGSRGRASGRGFRGQSPPEAESM